MNDTPTEGELVRENHYRGRATPTTLRPSPVLVELAGTLTAGSALDLGCSRGDEAIWLAARGWGSPASTWQRARRRGCR